MSSVLLHLEEEDKAGSGQRKANVAQYPLSSTPLPYRYIHSLFKKAVSAVLRNRSVFDRLQLP